jgi:hypothetical protein
MYVMFRELYLLTSSNHSSKSATVVAENREDYYFLSLNFHFKQLPHNELRYQCQTPILREDTSGKSAAELRQTASSQKPGSHAIIHQTDMDVPGIAAVPMPCRQPVTRPHRHDSRSLNMWAAQRTVRLKMGYHIFNTVQRLQPSGIQLR